MDLPLLKNDITRIFIDMKRVFYISVVGFFSNIRLYYRISPQFMSSNISSNFPCIPNLSPDAMICFR